MNGTGILKVYLVQSKKYANQLTFCLCISARMGVGSIEGYRSCYNVTMIGLGIS
jgi:hypothetical protein